MCVVARWARACNIERFTVHVGPPSQPPPSSRLATRQASQEHEPRPTFLNLNFLPPCDESSVTVCRKKRSLDWIHGSPFGSSQARCTQQCESLWLSIGRQHRDRDCFCQCRCVLLALVIAAVSLRFDMSCNSCSTADSGQKSQQWSPAQALFFAGMAAQKG